MIQDDRDKFIGNHQWFNEFFDLLVLQWYLADKVVTTAVVTGPGDRLVASPPV